MKSAKLKFLYTSLMISAIFISYFYFARSAIIGLPVKVVSVVDGDTIKVVFRGETNNVRLLGIDCPETRHTKKQAEQAVMWGITIEQVAEIGKLGTDRVTGLIQCNGKVRLIFPRAEIKKDYFRRYLAYVEVDGKDIGALVLKEGLADVYEAKHQRRDKYRKLRAEAVVNGVGLFE